MTTYFKSLSSFVLWILLLTVAAEAMAQSPSSNYTRTLKKANQYYQSNNFDEALPLYLELVKEIPNDALSNLAVAQIYVSRTAHEEQQKAIPYLEAAAKNELKQEVTPEVFSMLGHLYHRSYQFDKAIKAYESYVKTPYLAATKKTEAQKQIQINKNGKELTANKREVFIQSLQGEGINTIH